MTTDGATSTMHELDPERQAEEIWREYEHPAVQRKVLNPLDGCPWSVFANRVSEDYMAEEADEFVPLGPQHYDWIERFAAGEDFALLAHRYALKTFTILTYIAGRLEYDPGFTALWITNTQDQAKDKADREFNKLVRRSPWLMNLQEDVRQEDTIQTKVFPNGSTFNSAWLFGGLEGARADLIVFDDVIKEKGDGDTHDIWQWITGAAMPIGKRDSQEVFIGTRKRPDDIYEYIRAETEFPLYEYPLVLDFWDQEYGADADWQQRRPDPELYTDLENPLSDGDDTIQVLWPEARGPDFLREKRGKTGSQMFQRAYCLVLSGAEGDLVDKPDIDKPVDEGGCSIRGRSPPQQYRAGPGETIVVSFDPASSPSGDNAAFESWLVRRDGTRVLLEAIAAKGLKPSQVEETLVGLDRRYDPAVVAIEDNGIQQFIVESAIEWDAQLAAKTVGFNTGSEKHSLENGIPRLQTLVENGRIHFYRGHDGTEDFITAAQSLRMSNGTLEGHTPDLIMAWYMAEKAIRRLHVDDGDQDDVDDADGGDGGVSYL
jgi:hypothetical protein